MRVPGDRLISRVVRMALFRLAEAEKITLETQNERPHRRHDRSETISLYIFIVLVAGRALLV